MKFALGCAPWVGDTHCNDVRPRLLIVGLGRVPHLDLLLVACFGG